MTNAIKKVVFYITFIALGVFWAEVVSTKIPFGLVTYPLYLSYGLLYVIFIDALMRWKVRDFKVWYLFGALVGIITETYVAKVIFYGTQPNVWRIFGVAPGPIAFIILFYHAFFSFLAPAYFARRVLYMPLPIAPNKWIDRLFLLVPFIMFPVVSSKLILEGWDIMALVSLVSISAIILSLWILLLRFVGDIKDVILSRWERIGVIAFAVIAYIYFLFNATNKSHGHAPTDFPVVPMIVISIIIAALLALIFKSISKNEEQKEPLTYDGRTINLRLFCGWLFWYIALTTVLSLKAPPLLVVKISLIVLGVTGAIIGLWMFTRSVIGLFRACQK
ncbi:MAG: hypothetical protein KAS92_06530 [Candidatus Omnitrophica bacterium]|nr:hypothetical protein [Candidatus Omnitrophota bacterium]